MARHRHSSDRDGRPAPALEELAAVYQEHIGFVWRVVARMGVPREAVPDVAQDVFLVVHRRLPDFDGRASMRAWLAGICRGVVRNHLRASARRRRRLELLPPPQADAPEAERMELGDLVARCIDGLDEDQRDALVLVDIEGLAPAEVARTLGVSRNTIYSRVRLARAKLRERLAALSSDVGDSA
ncbi:MAG: sigma-70 family RNA polymerase sigma factor [Myxococcota bacterium]